MQQAFETAGIAEPAHIGAVHVLRHSGAIARLEQIGDPKALQDRLRHQDARMILLSEDGLCRAELGNTGGSIGYGRRR